MSGSIHHRRLIYAFSKLNIRISEILVYSEGIRGDYVSYQILIDRHESTPSPYISFHSKMLQDLGRQRKQQSFEILEQFLAGSMMEEGSFPEEV